VRAARAAPELGDKRAGRHHRKACVRERGCQKDGEHDRIRLVRGAADCAGDRRDGRVCGAGKARVVDGPVPHGAPVRKHDTPRQDEEGLEQEGEPDDDAGRKRGGVQGRQDGQGVRERKEEAPHGIAGSRAADRMATVVWHMLHDGTLYDRRKDALYARRLERTGKE